MTCILLAIAIGYCFPQTAQDFKPLGDDFIKLIKFIIAPIIFLTVALGIAGEHNAKSVGRVGVKALVYFEIVSTFSLIIGLAVALLVRPGDGFNLDPSTISTHDVQTYVDQSKHQSTVEFLSNIIPTSIVEPFLKGDILQVLFFAILFGFALLGLGETAKPMRDFLNQASKVVFGITNMVMRLAPLGAFGAMAFVVGRYGIGSLIDLGRLVACFYLTAILFVLIVLGSIAAACGFSILSFLNYIKEELLIVLGTSSSESALAPLMAKLERLGCSKQVVGLVVPAGYSFNLDGTNIYMTLAALFIAQATNTHLTGLQIAVLLGVAMLTSKGASGVTGSGFIILAATISSVPSIPVGGIAIIFAVDKFMSECRALTNIIGNGIATIVVSRWEGELDRVKLATGLRAPQAAYAD